MHKSDVLTFIDQFQGKATNARGNTGVRAHADGVEVKLANLSFQPTQDINPVRKRSVTKWEDWPYTVRWDAGVMPWIVK